MGYRDEAIRRLKEDGSWDKMTTDWQNTFEQISDGLAGELLAHVDDLDAQATAEDLLRGTTEKERKAQALKALRADLLTLHEMFGGQLVCLDPLELTELGQALANFVATARSCGFADQETANQLTPITWRTLWLLDRIANPHEA